MARARSWHDVRSDAIAAGVVTEEGIAEARRRHDDQIRAYRLRQVRKSQSVRQEDVAERMKISQSRVSRIERGDLEHVEVATLRSYIEALGGHVEIVADFGDDRIVVA
ncbi:MAG: XRE family transcriptional regulator [Streptosporangiaceae bacterium]